MSSRATESLPPSRYSNPFATCWTRPDVVAFQFVNGGSAEQLVLQLAAQNWRGAIVGHHGSGKSTLLATLKPLLVAAGRTIKCISPDAVAPRQLRRAAHPATIVVVDGYEQLGLLGRWRLQRFCRRHAAGLLVTGHIPTALPTLITLKPNWATVERLVDRLHAQAKAPARITADDVADSFARHGSNLRELLFDLYDRHERLCRASANAYSAADI